MKESFSTASLASETMALNVLHIHRFYIFRASYRALMEGTIEIWTTRSAREYFPFRLNVCNWRAPLSFNSLLCESVNPSGVMCEVWTLANIRLETAMSCAKDETNVRRSLCTLLIRGSVSLL